MESKLIKFIVRCMIVCLSHITVFKIVGCATVEECIKFRKRALSRFENVSSMVCSDPGVRNFDARAHNQCTLYLIIVLTRNKDERTYAYRDMALRFKFRTSF